LNKCDNFVFTAIFHISNAMIEKLSMILIKRSNLGVLGYSFSLSFSFTGTQIFLHTSKMVDRLRRLKSV